MNAPLLHILTILAAIFAHQAYASDACTQRAIEAHATVAVSDGTAFEVTTYFRDRDFVAIHFGGERESTIIAEGPYAWAIQDGEAKLIGDSNKSFALGHQYHAMVLYFEETFENIIPVDKIDFGGRRYRGKRGDFPQGGSAILIEGRKPGRPVGIRFELPDAPVIDTFFSDWRHHEGFDLPYALRIDDGQRQFDYRYTKISTTDKSPLWFQDVLPVKNLEKLEIYRLHRRLMAAHCLGDADLLSALTAPETVVANRGELSRPTREDTLTLFRDVFEAMAYDRYEDLAVPDIDVSGDLGWVVVNVRTAGKRKSDDKEFDRQWAWIMLVKKIDGVWLNAGNASNFAPRLNET